MRSGELEPRGRAASWATPRPPCSPRCHLPLRLILARQVCHTPNLHSFDAIKQDNSLPLPVHPLLAGLGLPLRTLQVLQAATIYIS